MARSGFQENSSRLQAYESSVSTADESPREEKRNESVSMVFDTLVNLPRMINAPTICHLKNLTTLDDIKKYCTSTFTLPNVSQKHRLNTSPSFYFAVELLANLTHEWQSMLKRIQELLADFELTSVDAMELNSTKSYLERRIAEDNSLIHNDINTIFTNFETCLNKLQVKAITYISTMNTLFLQLEGYKLDFVIQKNCNSEEDNELLDAINDTNPGLINLDRLLKQLGQCYHNRLTLLERHQDNLVILHQQLTQHKAAAKAINSSSKLSTIKRFWCCNTTPNNQVHAIPRATSRRYDVSHRF